MTALFSYGIHAQEKQISISYSMSFSDQSSFDNAIGFVGSSSYDQFMQLQTQSGNQRAAALNSISKLENHYLLTHNKVLYDSYSPKLKAQALARYASQQAFVSPSEGMILSDLVIRDIIAKPQDWKSIVQKSKNDLSFNEKVNIASNLGGKFGDDYNYDRADAGKDAGKAVSLPELLSKLSTNDAGGVCRDIALAQSQILTELGVPSNNVYTMAYANATGYHAVLIVQDPENKNKVVKVNYDYVQEIEGQPGSASLYIDGGLTNVGMGVKLYDYKGRPVSTLPTEIGQVFRDVTNSDLATEAPLYNIQKVIMVGRWGTGTLFSGTTSDTGDQFMGLAINKRLTDENRPSQTEIGVAVIQRTGDERELITFDQQAVYVRLKNWVEKNKTIGRVDISAIAGTELEAEVMNSRVITRDSERERSGVNYEANVFAFIGGKAQIKSLNERAAFESGVMAYGRVDFKNVADGNAGGYTLVVDRVDLNNKVTYQLTPSSKVTGQANIVFREFGNTVNFKAGIENKRLNANAEFNYLVPLTNNMPSFVEDAQERYGFGVSKEIHRKVAKVPLKGQFYVTGNHFKDSDRNQVDMGITFRW